MEEILHQTKLCRPADERRLEADRPSFSTALCGDTERLPHPHRLAFALQLPLAGVGVRDRRLRCPPRRLADEHCPGLGRALDAGGRVDEIARHHPLPLGAERDRRLPGEDAGSESQLGHARLAGERLDRVDEVEGRAHRAFGVVLAGQRCPPDGHHGIADELLDGAAVAVDHRPSRVEVASLELAHVLEVASL